MGEDAQSVPPTSRRLETETTLSTPTPPPRPPGLYGPLVLSKASVCSRSETRTSLHEHSVQVKVTAATQPAVIPPRVMGGPPPTHDASVVLPIAGAHWPAEHPCPAGHTVEHPPQ